MRYAWSYYSQRVRRLWLISAKQSAWCCASMTTIDQNIHQCITHRLDSSSLHKLVTILPRIQWKARKTDSTLKNERVSWTGCDHHSQANIPRLLVVDFLPRNSRMLTGGRRYRPWRTSSGVEIYTELSRCHWGVAFSRCKAGLGQDFRNKWYVGHQLLRCLESYWIFRVF